MTESLIVYTLDGHTPVPTTNLLGWTRWFHEADRQVGNTETALHRVSTVFLGLDYSFGKGPPIVFETMVFDKGGGSSDAFENEMWRYSSWDDAEAGHASVVRRVKKAEAAAAKMVAERAKRD